MQLKDIARVVRSKNAGPRRLTLDVMFECPEDYQRALASGSFASAPIALLYGLTPSEVEVVNYEVRMR